MADTLLIRADANAQIGTGHVMRCLALAQEWKKFGGGVTFFTSEIPERLRQRIASEAMGIVSLNEPPGSAEDSDVIIRAARESGATVVVDGYQFDASYQERLKSAGVRLLWIDDYGHAKPYVAEWVLNQNLAANKSLYEERSETTRLLLGAHYVLLRQEFLEWQKWERSTRTESERILVTLGGGDSKNVTLKILQALLHPSLNVTVVVGSSNPNLESLRTYCSTKNFRLVVDATNMPELMAESDLAIAGGGTTVWELAFMGLPALLVTLADNQIANIKEACAVNVARPLGRPEELTSEKIYLAVTEMLVNPVWRQEISRRGRELIDGHGALRVCLHLTEDSLGLNRATEKDSRLLWEWANDPSVRSVSFSSATIPWQDHTRWFEKRMNDSDCHLWIARNTSGEPIGQARFDVTGNSAVISVSIGKTHRGKSLGALLIWVACRKLFRETTVNRVEALIKPENDASIRAFQKVGFEKTGAKEVNGKAALVFTFTRDRAEP